MVIASNFGISNAYSKYNDIKFSTPTNLPDGIIRQQYQSIHLNRSLIITKLTPSNVKLMNNVGFASEIICTRQKLF